MQKLYYNWQNREIEGERESEEEIGKSVHSFALQAKRLFLDCIEYQCECECEYECDGTAESK